MKAIITIIFICISSFAFAQEDDKETKSSFSKGDSIMVYQTICIDTVRLTTLIRKKRDKKSGSWISDAHGFKDIILTEAKAINYTGKSSETILKIDYLSNEFPSKYKSIILDTSCCKRISDFITLISNHDWNSEAQCQVSEKFSIGVYTQGGEKIYFVLIDGKEYLILDKNLFINELRKFTMHCSN